MTGWILSVRHRYVTDLIIFSDSVGNDHFSDYHRFFSQYTVSQRPTRIFYCMDVWKTPKEILSIFSQRWSIEVMHFDCKQYLGLADPANRTPLAVQRTALMAMFLYSPSVVWFATQGHKEV